MKLNESTIRIDVNSLKNHLAERGIDYSINQIKDDLKSLNAVVRAEKTEDGGLYMVVGGDIDMDRLESVFDECMVDVNEFIIDDIPNIENYGDDFEDIEDDINEFDDNAALESAGIDFPSFEDVEINEKKKDCCPKKKVNESKTTSIASLSKKHYSKKVNESKTGTSISSLGKEFYHKNQQANQHLIPLKEALSGKEIKFNKTPDVNEIIDSLTGKKNSRRINEAALAKARREAKKNINENYEFLSKKLGDDLAGRIWKALSEKKTSLYEKVKINGKAVSEFTLEELQQVYEKVCKKVNELESTSKTEGLNETDATNAEKKLTLNTRLKNILTEEIEFRNALKEADDNDAESFLDQFNLDPNADDNSGKENTSDENNDDSDNNDNPDNDQVEEIGSIVITMASEKAANDLKDELVQEGIPEDVIEIEAVEDEEDETEENNSEENNGEENNNEQSNESKTSKVKGKKLNEDDENNGGDNGDDNDQNDDENSDDSGSDENSDSEEKQYKVILTDTDYAEQLQTVMADYYGIEKNEFEQMIGGTIVDDENSESSDDNSSDENKDKDKDTDGDNSDEGGNDSDDNDSSEEEIDPETVFKGL